MISPLRFIFINDDNSSFTCVFPSQYCVFSCNPFELKYSKDNIGISLGSAATCCGYRYIALSGLPADPEFDTRHVCVMDHTLNEPVIFKHQFSQHILSLRVTPQYLVCVFHQHIEIWELDTGEPFFQLTCAVNVYAPCDLSNDYQLLAVSGKEITSFCLCNLTDHQGIHIPAADEAVSLIKFSKKRQFMATTSSDGKMVRVFELESNQCIGKFKRGNTASVIFSIDFSPNNNFMAVISQNGTLHFFDLRNKTPMPSVPTIRSFEKISIGQQLVSYIAWFAPNQIALLSMEGHMFKITIDEHSCKELGREQIMFMRRILETAD